MPTKHSYLDLLEANAYIRKASDSFYFQCTTRTVQESKLFPVNPYIALSYLNAWYRWPELLRKIDAAMPAEEIGDRARQVGTYVNTITMGLIPQFYLGGRQILIDMGMLKPTDAIDDVHVRARLRAPAQPLLPPRPRAHHPERRGATRPGPHGAPDAGRSRTTRSASRPATSCTRAFGHFMAAMSAYGFLSHCECRLSFCNHGPVQDAAAATRCSCATPSTSPSATTRGWTGSRRDRAQQPHDPGDHEGHPLQHRRRLGLASRRRPSYDAANIVAVGLYTSDFLSDGLPPGAHGQRLRPRRLPRPPRASR